MKKKIILGNWKMHKTIKEAADFIGKLLPYLPKSSNQIGLAVPFTAIWESSRLATGTSLKIGAQNMSDATEGAFTGEIAASMLKDAGAQFVLLGHSERRRIFHETDAFIQAKVTRALQEGLEIVLCIGETQEERRRDFRAVLQKQLQTALQGISAFQTKSIMIAYEPVWAIGTGKVATPAEVQEVHSWIRECFQKRWPQETARLIPLLYGGSVQPDNISSFWKQPDIQGVLVGGASLHIKTFIEMVQS